MEYKVFLGHTSEMLRCAALLEANGQICLHTEIGYPMVMVELGRKR